MSETTIEWQPAKLLQDQESPSEFALLVLNQPLKNSTNLRRLWRNGKCAGLYEPDTAVSSLLRHEGTWGAWLTGLRFCSIDEGRSRWRR
jgi:hypothetical protein